MVFPGLRYLTLAANIIMLKGIGKFSVLCIQDIIPGGFGELPRRRMRRQMLKRMESNHKLSQKPVIKQASN
jgi:hypothetical protein